MSQTKSPVDPANSDAVPVDPTPAETSGAETLALNVGVSGAAVAKAAEEGGGGSTNG